jgi:hypothetical protein
VSKGGEIGEEKGFWRTGPRGQSPVPPLSGV